MRWSMFGNYSLSKMITHNVGINSEHSAVLGVQLCWC